MPDGKCRAFQAPMYLLPSWGLQPPVVPTAIPIGDALQWDSSIDTQLLIFRPLGM